MKTKKKSGFAIELMIVFMVVAFGFCVIVTSLLSSIITERKVANTELNWQITLNQVGEYYLRYIENGTGKFPTGEETAFTDTVYNWMDDEAKAFFLNLNSNYQLKYEPAYSIKRGSLLEFYQTKYIWRKLLVKSSNDSIRLVIELKEQRTNAPQTADYRIKYWMVGEGLEDPSADGTYKPDDLNVLQKLWVFLGLQINSFSTWTPTGQLSDLASLFSMASGNWNDAFSEPF